MAAWLELIKKYYFRISAVSSLSWAAVRVRVMWFSERNCLSIKRFAAGGFCTLFIVKLMFLCQPSVCTNFSCWSERRKAIRPRKFVCVLVYLYLSLLRVQQV